MSNKFLYDELDTLSKWGGIPKSIPDSVAQNLNPRYELRVLEELNYHSINDSRYIPEITQALVEQGMMDERVVERHLTLKGSFKKTRFYKYGIVWINDRQLKDYQRIRSFADLGVKKRNFIHFIATGHGAATVALEKAQKDTVVKDETRQDVKVRDIEHNIVQSAIGRSPFFTFASLKRYFPHLISMQEFIASNDYLGGLEITFQGNLYMLEENKAEKLTAMIDLLNQIESEIHQQITKYEGSREFRHDRVHKVFTNKVLRFDKENERGKDDAQFEHFVSDKDWFAFNTIYGTSEEKAFVRMLDRQMNKLKEQYDSVYLVRNEGHFSVHNFSDGQAFQPDFVLFLREKNGQTLTYQMFIEPKGKHLKDYDHWKETFLKEISEEFKGKSLTFEDKKYRLIGVPFYNNEDENAFKASLWEFLKQGSDFNSQDAPVVDRKESSSLDEMPT